MVAKNNEIATLLRARGYSITKARTVIFSTLSQHQPLTMTELVALCKIEHVDRASVYRTVELFVELGIFKRISFGWKYRLELGDSFSGHHHHARCTVCGKLFDAPENSDLETSLLALANSMNFKLISHDVELHGICRDCS